MDMSTAYHPTNRRQSEETIQTLGGYAACCAIKLEKAQYSGPDVIQETTEKIIHNQAKDAAARDRQKSYVDLKRKPIEFPSRIKLMLKVRHWKGVLRFRKKRGSKNPMYVGHSSSFRKGRRGAYKLELPEELISATTKTSSSDTTIPQSPIPIIQPQQQTHDPITTTTIPTTTVPEIPNFASLFGFERRVSSLEIELFELKQTNQFAEAVSSIPGIVDNYLTSKLKDEVNVALQLNPTSSEKKLKQRIKTYSIQLTPT
ncbi:hypothetical protein Tco_0794086 [Tanacetum coccineum]